MYIVFRQMQHSFVQRFKGFVTTFTHIVFPTYSHLKTIYTIYSHKTSTNKSSECKTEYLYVHYIEFSYQNV